MDLPRLRAGSYGKIVTLDNPRLSQLADGRWTIQVRDIYDGVGNYFDADPSTDRSEPYETEIELW